MIKKLFKNHHPLVSKKELHIQEHQRVWRQKGSLLKNMRKNAGITVADMARHLKVSPGRLYRFEAGEPVRDAKLLEASYLSVMRYGEMKVLLLEIMELMEGAGLNDSHRIK
ncbi:MAG: helix-turn-helix domain-containing protein [Bacillota bacterium]